MEFLCTHPVLIFHLIAKVIASGSFEFLLTNSPFREENDTYLTVCLKELQPLIRYEGRCSYGNFTVVLNESSSVITFPFIFGWPVSRLNFIVLIK